MADGLQDGQGVCAHCKEETKPGATFCKTCRNWQPGAAPEPFTDRLSKISTIATSLTGLVGVLIGGWAAFKDFATSAIKRDGAVLVGFSAPETVQVGPGELPAFLLQVTNIGASPGLLLNGITCLMEGAPFKVKTEPSVVHFLSEKAVPLKTAESAIVSFKYNNSSPIVFGSTDDAVQYWTSDEGAPSKYDCRFSYINKYGDADIGWIHKVDFLDFYPTL
jgi:hypothetical protein